MINTEQDIDYLIKPPIKVEVFASLLAHKIRKLTGETPAEEGVNKFSVATGVDAGHIQAVLDVVEHPSDELLDSVLWKYEIVEVVEPRIVKTRLYYPASMDFKND